MVDLVEKILYDKLHRKQLIKDFQNIIWDNMSQQVTEKDEILSQLAYDLDFYEPDENLRKEVGSYYGDELLEKEIKSVLLKIRSLTI